MNYCLSTIFFFSLILNSYSFINIRNKIITFSRFTAETNISLNKIEEKILELKKESKKLTESLANTENTKEILNRLEKITPILESHRVLTEVNADLDNLNKNYEELTLKMGETEMDNFFKKIISARDELELYFNKIISNDEV